MADASFHIEVVTPERLIYSGQAVSVTAPGRLGYFGILAHHLPLVAELGLGELTIRQADGQLARMALLGGFFEVSGNNAIVLADGGELAPEIDLNRAKVAADRARKALEDLDDPNVDRELMRAALTRAETRLKVAHHAGR
ncbi:MAG: ATP synthase F1 subunit epsilon [Candidatus Wallbacteria bacterium]|nr:ATP synthase F1 subunit epsilon [Candidatus Wallbacteria bacterium]